MIMITMKSLTSKLEKPSASIETMAMEREVSSILTLDVSFRFSAINVQSAINDENQC
jgi:hypothetical protein